jgi:hypothetical protein
VDNAGFFVKNTWEEFAVKQGIDVYNLNDSGAYCDKF